MHSAWSVSTYSFLSLILVYIKKQHQYGRCLRICINYLLFWSTLKCVEQLQTWKSQQPSILIKFVYKLQSKLTVINDLYVETIPFLKLSLFISSLDVPHSNPIWQDGTCIAMFENEMVIKMKLVNLFWMLSISWLYFINKKFDLSGRNISVIADIKHCQYNQYTGLLQVLQWHQNAAGLVKIHLLIQKLLCKHTELLKLCICRIL